MKDLELIKNALNKSNKSGVFTLEESALVFNAIQTHERFIDKITSQLANNSEKENKVKETNGKRRRKQ